jgi:hypothetical protein
MIMLAGRQELQDYVPHLFEEDQALLQPRAQPYPLEAGLSIPGAERETDVPCVAHFPGYTETFL